MANCPKCGYKLRMIDVKADCPKCGVNLIYYNHQERLDEDADKAEEEMINFQPKIDRVKFAFKGTKLSIARIILILIPIGMLFLPLANISCVGLPYHDIDTSFSLMSVINDYEAVLNFGLSLPQFADSTLAMILFFVCLLCVVIAALFSLISLVACAFSCSPKGFKRNITLASIGVAAGVIGNISLAIFNSQLHAALPENYTGSNGIGAILVIVAYLLILGVNILIKKQNVPVKYKDVSEYVERMERRKKEKAELEAKAAALLNAEKEVPVTAE